MKRLLSIILCICLLLCLTSCGGDTEETESSSTSTKQTYVEDLKIAIKKNPTGYNGKQITVEGYACLYSNVIYLCDIYYGTNAMDRFEFNKNTKSKIEIVITDDVLLSVLGNGDYIKVTGKVKIAEGEFYLDNCTYTMITTYEERQ